MISIQAQVLHFHKSIQGMAPFLQDLPMFYKKPFQVLCFDFHICFALLL